MYQDHAPSGSNDLFAEVISAYTDGEALDDGILVDLTQFAPVWFLGLPVNRMTSHLFEDLQSCLSTVPDEDATRFSSALASVLRTKCGVAQGDPGNTGEIGDIFRIPPNLWLVRNGVGGWTAMYPEDY